MKIKSIRVAVPIELGPHSRPSGIDKREADKKVKLTFMGLTGDFQVDTRVHGGKEKALYQYPFENYPKLSSELPECAGKFKQPCVGENISSTGMTESDVYIGDIYRVGSALVQVSQPRMPCWKLNAFIGHNDMMKVFIDLKASGWYYRVMEEGELAIEDDFDLVERIQNDYSVEDIWTLRTTLKENKSHPATRPAIEALSTEWKF